MFLKRTASAVAIFILMLSSTGRAVPPSGLYLTLGLIAYQLKFDNSSMPTEEKTFMSAETGLGLILDDWAFIGGHFTYSPTVEKVGSVKHDITYQYYGPSLGWMGESWMVIGTYLAYAESRDAAPWGTTVRTGTGFGGSVGYRFDMGGFELGPVIDYKSVKFTNCKDPFSGATSTCDPAINLSEITPYVTFLYSFH